MPLSSEAKIAANRLNAQKSTGPKTTRGKERSRANAVKHGLTGEGVALPTEDAAEVEHRFMALQDELAPQTVLGVFLAHKMALMTVRCQRAARQETAALALKVRHAADDFDEARAAEADHLIAWIMTEPRTYHRKLKATPEGTDLLINGLLGLKMDLDRTDRFVWEWNHTMKLESYFGRRESDLPHSRGYILSKVIDGDDKEIDSSEIAHITTRNDKANWAADRLVPYIEAEVARLRAHRETLDHERHAIDRAEAAERALFDPSKEATLARRYEAAATQELYRALREFRKVEATGEIESLEGSEVVEKILEAGDMADAPRPEIESKPQQDSDLDPTLGSFGKTTSGDSKPFDSATRPARTNLKSDLQTSNSPLESQGLPGPVAG